MISRKNNLLKQEKLKTVMPRYGLRKLSIGVASVLTGTALYVGMPSQSVYADTSINTTQVSSEKDMAAASSQPIEMAQSSASEASNIQQSTVSAATPASASASSAASSAVQNSSLSDAAANPALPSNELPVSSTSAGLTSSELPVSSSSVDSTSNPAVTDSSAASNAGSSSSSSAQNNTADTSTNSSSTSEPKPDISQWKYAIDSQFGMFGGTYIILNSYTGTIGSTLVVPNAADFGNASAYVYIDINLLQGFLKNKNLTSLIFSNTDGGKVYVTESGSFYPVDSYNGLFKDATYLTYLDLSGFGTCKPLTPGVSSLAHMFEGDSNLKTIIGLDGFSTNFVNDISYMFAGCSSLTNLTGLADWNVGNVEHMDHVFYGCTNLNFLDLSGWSLNCLGSFPSNSETFYTDSYVPLEVIANDSKLKNYNYAADNRARTVTIKLNGNGTQRYIISDHVAFDTSQDTIDRYNGYIKSLQEDASNSSNPYQKIDQAYLSAITNHQDLKYTLLYTWSVFSSFRNYTPTSSKGYIFKKFVLADGEDQPGESMTPSKLLTATFIPSFDHYITVDWNSPQSNGTVIPNAADGVTYQGVTANDLTKTVTRKITVKTPNGKDITTVQTAELHRDATVDLLNGAVTYGAWSTGSWDSYDVPVENGYTPNIGKVAETTVTGDTEDTQITINYASNKQSVQIDYVDADGKIINSDTINGELNQTVPLDINAPAGWKLMPNQTIPKSIKLSGSQAKAIKVQIEHAYATVDWNDPQSNGTVIPNAADGVTYQGVTANDLTKTVTRKITLKMPNGTEVTIVQAAELHRDATIDLTDGAVTYGAWSTGNWNEYTVPGVSGYTPSQSVVKAESVTGASNDETISISYVKNQGQESNVGSNVQNTGSGEDKNVSSTESSVGTNTKSTNASSMNSQSKENDKKLPQLGNERNSLSVMGLIAVAFAAMIELIGKKRKTEEN